MNAALVVEASVKQLPIELIRASATNPRQRVDPARLHDLQSSISTSGMQTPIIVRDQLDYFELVTGSRRLQAAENLGWETVPGIVREMTDAEARQWQIVENLQRENVHPLDEAEAFQALLEDVGSIAEVATRLGKEQSYVARCLRLMALTLPSRDALRGGLMSIEHALLLARLAEAEQNAALKWTLDRNAGSKTSVQNVVDERLARRAQEDADRLENPGASSRYFRPSWEAETVVRLKAWIEAESGILLSRAPWSLTDEDYLLPDVGPCCECPKNTKANTPLFGDLEMGEATCTDGACFAAKTSSFVQIAMRGAGHDETAKPKVLVPRLSWKCSSVKPAVCPNDLARAVVAAETANPAKLLKKGQWIEAKPGSCTNVRPGITADWSDDGDRGYGGGSKKLRVPGEVLQICIAVGCKVHRKDWEQPKGAVRQLEQRDPAAEKREAEERAHIEKVEGQIRMRVMLAILGKLDAVKVTALILDRYHGAPKWYERLSVEMPGLDQLTLNLFAIFAAGSGRSLEPNTWWMMQSGGVAKDRKDLFDLAKAAGVDATQVVAKFFHDQGSIAPASERLYPKGVPWPKAAGAKAVSAKAVAKKAPAKKVVAKAVPAKVAVKSVAKKAAKLKLSSAGRKAIADAMKKRWAERRSEATAKPVAKKVAAKKSPAKKAVR